MLSFITYINEITLRGHGGDRKRVENAVAEFLRKTKPHPMDNKASIVGNAVMHISPSGDGIHVHDIYSLDKGSGAGTKAMEFLVDIADKHEVKIHLFADGYSDTSSSDLRRWYSRFGFVPNRQDPSEMVRPPKP